MPAMISTSFRYIRQNAIAFLALFIALSGTAIAAGLPKNSVGNKQLKNSAVTSKKVKKNTLTGTQINELKLGRVPEASSALTAGSAATASSAANADKLDGIDSSVLGTALTVPGSVFAPRDTASGITKAYDGTGAIHAAGGTGDFHYAVSLPQGARVTSLGYRYVDNDANSNSLELYAFNSIDANGTESDNLVVASSTGASAARRVAVGTPTEPVVIDNTKWSYVLVWTTSTASAASQLVGGQITYTLPTS